MSDVGEEHLPVGWKRGLCGKPTPIPRFHDKPCQSSRRVLDPYTSGTGIILLKLIIPKHEDIYIYISTSQMPTDFAICTAIFLLASR